MRLLLLFLFVSCRLKAQTDSVNHKLIFFDDFNDNKNSWLVSSARNESGHMENGFYYLATSGHAYGQAQKVTIDTRKDFEISMRIRIADGKPEHKNYYSMLFWGSDGSAAYYFTFAKDGFASVESCEGKNQSSCVVQKNSLQKSNLVPDSFNIYTIRKTRHTYSFLINGKEFYEMAFEPFFGDLVGFGAGRKSTLEVDYIKVSYL